MTLEEANNLIPLKCWFILREDLQYSSSRLLTIGIKNISAPFYYENIRKAWVDQGSRFETYMMFNMRFLENLESLLIEKGQIFKWIYDNKTPVGILIEPSRFYFRDLILKDCMTLDEYAIHRLDQFNELKERTYRK